MVPAAEKPNKGEYEHPRRYDRDNNPGYDVEYWASKNSTVKEKNRELGESKCRIREHYENIGSLNGGANFQQDRHGILWRDCCGQMVSKRPLLNAPDLSATASPDEELVTRQ